MDREEKICNYLIDLLGYFCPIKWHKSKHNSICIKFKDTRLGSIRIANHKVRGKYNYKYNIDSRDETKMIMSYIRFIVNDLNDKALNINYVPNKYIVYNRYKKIYIEVFGYEEYKRFILRK